MPKNSNTDNGTDSWAMADTSTLPDLPKKRQKREAKVTPRVLEWFRKAHKGPCAIEIKATKGNTVSESELAPHQKLALLAAMGEGIVHKLSDEARRKQPFDAFKLEGVPAYVVACFLSEPRIALVIHVKDWQGANRDTRCVWSFPV
jgi:hypothetical protein